MNCFNREEIKNKCHGCWIGKNIGGTIGTPYEGKQEMNHAEGFSSQPGEPLANDDLDLQLVWLLAMEKSGPWFLDEQKLGDYWLAMISPHWNEYGLCKGNMLAGYLPPLSGELNNPIWKDSNGAWIRSEIWASLAPGHPGIARRYAFADACVDHGFGEGTYAALFTATLESEAYLYSSKEDIRLILEKALAAIPRDCRVAKAVSLAIEEYDKHTPYEVTREKLAEQSRDIGVFEAPANLGYVTIGLLYGEGDFKKSVLTATRCGDDTDCTAGTVGAFLGILYGADGIPADWKQYIGDRIVTCSLNAEYGWRFPKTCEELTRRVMKMMPAVFLANESEMEWTDTGKTVLDKARETKGRVPLLLEAFLSGKASPFSVGLPGCFFVTGYVSYSDAPVYAPQKELKATVRLYNKIEEYMWITPEIRVPDGWETTQPSSVLLPYTYRDGKENEFTFTLKMGDCPGTRKVLLVLRTPSHPKPLMAELSF